MKTKGFTLIEILVVSTIIGLLAAVSAVSFTSLTRQSRDARRKADLEQIRGALEMYKSNNNVYPNPAIDCTSTGNIQDATNTYLPKSPKDPKCTTIKYWYSTTGSTYTLGACLEGGNSASATRCGNCGSCNGSTQCNYCLGPYGLQ